MYSLKKVFKFRTVEQATSFGEILHVYGRVSFFGTEVIFVGTLDFLLWRKLNALAKLICDRFAKTEVDNVSALAEEAGLKVSKDTSA